MKVVREKLLQIGTGRVCFSAPGEKRCERTTWAGKYIVCGHLHALAVCEFLNAKSRENASLAVSLDLTKKNANYGRLNDMKYFAGALELSAPTSLILTLTNVSAANAK